MIVGWPAIHFGADNYSNFNRGTIERPHQVSEILVRPEVPFRGPLRIRRPRPKGFLCWLPRGLLQVRRSEETGLVLD